jgi:hypothetical protein
VATLPEAAARAREVTAAMRASGAGAPGDPTS